jgi:hypothetical protein
MHLWIAVAEEQPRETENESAGAGIYVLHESPVDRGFEFSIANAHCVSSMSWNCTSVFPFLTANASAQWPQFWGRQTPALEAFGRYIGNVYILPIPRLWNWIE